MSILDADVKEIEHAVQWNLHPPYQFEPFIPSSAVVPGIDNRREVPDNEKAPGTTYYSIARLRMQYSSKPGWFLGTGFMISEDIMVTAGHNVYDWNTQQAGPATVIEAYFGNTASGWLETRYAISATVSEKYVFENPDGDWKRDFALVRLSPRQGPHLTPLKPFRQGDLPFAGQANLIIVGYPADISEGRRMIEGEAVVTWKLGKWSQATPEPGPKGVLIDLAGGTYMKFDPKSWKLDHTVTTFGGVSGSPVLQPDKETFVGVHVAGTGNAGPQSNSACPVGGIGRVVGPYFRVLNGHGRIIKTEVKSGVSVNFMAVDVEETDYPTLIPTKR